MARNCPGWPGLPVVVAKLLIWDGLAKRVCFPDAALEQVFDYLPKGYDGKDYFYAGG